MIADFPCPPSSYLHSLCRFQICVDVFACGSTYMDLPSLGALPKYTGGQLYYYPGFAAERDGPKLRAEVM
jgi:protein transport protein SEC24